MQPVTFKADQRARIIGKPDDALHAQIVQDLRADAVIADFRRNRMGLPALQANGKRIGPWVAQQHDNAAPRRINHAHRRMQIAKPAARDDFAEQGRRMHAHQHRRISADIALHQRQMLTRCCRAFIDNGAPGAANRLFNLAFLNAAHQLFRAAAIGDQISDGAKLQAMMLREGHQIRHARHAAVIIHDLTNHAGRIEPRKPREIHRRFRMAGAHQRAAFARHQRKDMAGCDDMFPPQFGIDRNGDGARTISRRNARGHTIARFNGNGEGGLVPRAIGLRHQRQAQLIHPCARHGKADQATRIACHEIDCIRRRELRGDHQIALILAVFVIHQDEHAPTAGFFQQFPGWRDEVGEGSTDGVFRGLGSHALNSIMRAT